MGAQSGKGTEAVTRLRAAFLAALIASGATAAAAASPFSFADADLRLAWEESAASFATPSFADYLEGRTEAFAEDIPRLFKAGAARNAESDGTPSFAPENERPDSHSFTEVGASGGTAGRIEIAGFQGWEINFLDAAASFRDSRYTSGDGFYDNDFLRADAEVAFSDQAGTTVAFGADYEGKTEKLQGGTAPLVGQAGDNVARSGQGSAGFRSNLWGKAKFATEVSATFSEGDYLERRTVDQVIAANSSYGFFWLGENLSRGALTLSQENYEVEGEEQGFLGGRASLENDFPIADRLYLLGGFGAYLFRGDTPLFRLYPRGRLLLRLTRGWGYFVDYRPGFRAPSFRELYIHNDYAIPTAFRPVEDEYFAARSGVNYYFRQRGRVTAAAYEKRLRQTYAATDTRVAGVTYFDAGRVRIRGADFSYRITLGRVEHYAGAEYKRAWLRDAPEGHFPYLPAYEGNAGLTCKFGAGHSASLEARLLGERYATPAAPTPLAAAWVPNANLSFRLRSSISITAAAENFTDETYYEAGGILAPGRSFQVGMNFVL
jgi:hypothetical protein